MGKVMMSGIVPQLKVPVLRLPNGYTELAYIQSSGTQYVDTAFAPSAENMKVALEFEYTATHNAHALFGTQLGSNQQTMMVAFGEPRFYAGTTYGILPQTTQLNTKYLLECHANNGTMTVLLNGNKQSASYTGTLYKGNTLALFGNKAAGSVASMVSAKLYSCQIYDNGTLVRDFIPCINLSGEVGLYDRVGKQFYGNAGTGVFIGSEVA